MHIHIHALATLIENPLITLVIWEEDLKFYINNVNSFCLKHTRYDWAEEDTLRHLLSTVPPDKYNLVFAAQHPN